MNKPTETFTGHLSELRTRIFKILLFVIGGFILSYFFSEEILTFIKKPIQPYLLATNGELIFISPFEKFFSSIWLAFFTGTVLSSPFWIYQIWEFIAPALYKKEKRGVLLFTIVSIGCFLLGILFVYFLVYPLSFQFLIGFGGEALPYISLKPYLSFFIRTSFVFGFIFETPLVLFILLKFRFLTAQQLKKARPYVVVLIAFLSAIITPPDIFSMLFMMLPLYLLFELSIFIGQKLSS